MHAIICKNMAYEFPMQTIQFFFQNIDHNSVRKKSNNKIKKPAHVFKG